MPHPPRPARPGAFIWWWSGLVTRPFVRASPTVRSGERTAGQASDRAIDLALGSNPDMEHRESLLGILTNSAIVLGASVLVLSTLAGVGFDALTGGSTGLFVARATGIVLAAPLLALGTVWALRWAVARRDLARQRGPSPASQPGARDLAYSAPMALLLAMFFAFV